MTNLSQKNLWFVAAVAVGMGFLFDYFFYGQQAGISFVLYIAISLGVLYSLLEYLKIPYNRQTLWYLIPMLFFAGMLAIRASYFLVFWNLLLTLALLLIFTYHHLGKSIKNYLLFDFIKTGVMVPLDVLSKGLNALVRLFTFNKKPHNNQRLSQIIKGIAITLPIFIFFLLLLSSADLAFGSLVDNLFSFNISLDPGLIAQFIIVSIISFIVLGGLILVLEKFSPHPLPPSEDLNKAHKFGTIEAGILFGSINFLFLVFVIIQIKYLFAGHSAITELGYTYAEYAHKGFAELVLVSITTFFLIFGTEKYLEKKTDGHFPLFKSLSAIMVCLMLVIMASAFIRLTIYEQAYGFTLLRILVQGFILWLGVVLLGLIYKIFAMLPEREFCFGLFVSVLVFFIVLNLMNPDAFIARKNIDQFAKSNLLDTSYLETLSSDAVNEVVKLRDLSGYQDKAGQSLDVSAERILFDMEHKSATASWQSFNFSRQRALYLIDQKFFKN